MCRRLLRELQMQGRQVSTYWSYECMDHDPPIVSEEFTQHTGDRHWVHGLDLVARRPIEPDERRWLGGWLSGEEQADRYFTMNATRFLSAHPNCRLGIVSEYGEHLTVEEAKTHA